MSAHLIGVDIGGTFTDLVIADGANGATRNFKTLTTHDPVDGVVTALREALAATGASAAGIARFVHATTLPTNLVLERKGAKVGFLVTRGFGQMFTFSKQWPRGNSAYDLDYQRQPPFVEPEMVFEIDERMTYEGKVFRAFDEEAARAQVERLADGEPESVAICLLHSYVNPAHEQRLAELVRERLPGIHVAVSSEIWPEAGEYERAATAVISAYVGSLFSDYLDRLAERLAQEGLTCGVQVMQSSGGVMAAQDCGQRAVFAIESGPAAGVMASAHVSRIGGFDDLISFDMGGTTAKAGLIVDGRPRITHDFRVGASASAHNLGDGEPVRIPVIDLAEVGAGGGSVAWIDSAGSLRVGPHSAGSSPGPACYGLGGTEPTVTDANVLLGYLDPGYFLGGKMEIFPDLGHEAIQTLAGRLGLEAMAVAKGIHDLANAHMGGAVRIVTLHRGHDPRKRARGLRRGRSRACSEPRPGGRHPQGGGPTVAWRHVRLRPADLRSGLRLCGCKPVIHRRGRSRGSGSGLSGPRSTGCRRPREREAGRRAAPHRGALHQPVADHPDRGALRAGHPPDAAEGRRTVQR